MTDVGLWPGEKGVAYKTMTPVPFARDKRPFIIVLPIFQGTLVPVVPSAWLVLYLSINPRSMAGSLVDSS